MRSRAISVSAMMALAVSSVICTAQNAAAAGGLKLHNIFSSNMVIQRGKPIKLDLPEAESHRRGAAAPTRGARTSFGDISSFRRKSLAFR